MFITGPEVIKYRDPRGGHQRGSSLAARRRTAGSKSGVSHFTEAPTSCRASRGCAGAVVLHAGQQRRGDPPIVPTQDPPDREKRRARYGRARRVANKWYDIKKIITGGRRRREVRRGPGRTTRRTSSCGFAHFEGRSTGIVANQPMHLAGCLSIDASIKAARFVRFLRRVQHPDRDVRRRARLPPRVRPRSTAASSSTARSCSTRSPRRPSRRSPWITRKAYGGAYDVMSSKHIRGDVNVSYPAAEIAVMGPEGAVNIIFRSELRQDHRREGEGRGPRALHRRVQGAVREPVQGGITRVHRREDHPSARDAVDDRPLAGARSRTSGMTNLPRKHGNIPL